MKRIMIWAIMLLPVVGFSQATVDWYDFTGGVGIALDQNNNSYAAHYDYNPAGDIYLTKRNQQGNIIWQVSYNQTDNTKWEQATYVDTDRDGNIFVSGTLKSGYSNPVNAASIIMKFDSSGTLLWRQVYETSFDGSSTKQCMTDASGNVYVLGLGIGSSGMVTKVKKFNSVGNPVWSWFDSAGIGAPVRFKFTPDSSIVISARGIVGNFNGYARITQVGITTWSIAGVASLSVGDAAGDSNGNTYIVHAVNGSGGGSTLRKIASSGTVLWSSDFSPINAFFVEVGNDNMPVIAGFTSSGQVGSSFVKVDTNGGQLWYNPDGDGINAFLSHARIRMDAQNNIYLAASIMTAMGVCRVNSNGTNEWAITVPTGYSQDFRIGSDQAVYVVGGTTARIEQIVTPPSCIPPVSTYSSFISASSFRANWTSVQGAFRYQVYYKVGGTPTWTQRSVAGNKIFMGIQNLNCGTNYRWKVRTVCQTPSGNIRSTWTPVEVTTTLACAANSNDRNSVAEDRGFEIYPNPANNKITIDPNIGIDTDTQFEVYNLTGMRLMISTNDHINEDGTIDFDVSSLSPGMYFVRISGQSNYSSKFIIQR